MVVLSAIIDSRLVWGIQYTANFFLVSYLTLFSRRVVEAPFESPRDEELPECAR